MRLTYKLATRTAVTTVTASEMTVYYDMYVACGQRLACKPPLRNISSNACRLANAPDPPTRCWS